MANLSFVDSDSVHRLEGSSGEECKGGLILMKKRPTPDDESSLVFKKPMTSLLGLDRLAAIKHKIKEEDKDKKWKENKRSPFNEDDDSQHRFEDSSKQKYRFHKDLKER